MQKTLSLVAILIVLPVLWGGCRGVVGSDPGVAPEAASESRPHTTPAAEFEEANETDDLTTEAGVDTQPPQDAPADRHGFSGTVVETMTTGPYTYIYVDRGEEKVWVAAPQFEVSVGDVVEVPAGLFMKNFRSRSLQRTFDEIFFVGSVSISGATESSHEETEPLPFGHPPLPGAESTKPSLPAGHPPLPGETAPSADAPPHPGGEGETAALPPGHPPLPDAAHGADNQLRSSVDPVEIDLSGIRKAEGGVTVEEVFARSEELAGKSVVLRGKVVKFNAHILRTNWLHVRDGSGKPGTDDLVVTTNQTVRVGDTVLIKGTVAVDRDFGAGYSYEVLVENATATVE